MTSAAKQNLILLYILISYGCLSQSTVTFGTSSYYVNVRIMTHESELYLPLYISKEISLMSARIQCAAYCAGNYDCLAFNFYGQGESFVCEIVADNLCTNLADKAFTTQADAFIYDKLEPPNKKSCIDSLASSGNGIPCQLLRPGCLGTWPNCNSCTKTCIDCDNRNLNSCVMWPDGSDLASVPIMGQCENARTILIARKVKPDTGEVLKNYHMAIYDMHRISRLKAYTIISFYFTNAWGQRLARYRNWSIDANGTLLNLVYVQPLISLIEKDIFFLNGGTLSAAPFVKVTDDRYGCGSFWLLDRNNATYCPGGETAFLGKPKFDGTRTVSTGIACARCDWGGLMATGNLMITN